MTHYQPSKRKGHLVIPVTILATITALSLVSPAPGQAKLPFGWGKCSQPSSQSENQAENEADSKSPSKDLSNETKSKNDSKVWCRARAVIKAPPSIVWLSVHNERQHDPDIAYSKVLEQEENHYKLEQKFVFIPLLGSSVCVMREVEVPFSRIDYSLLKSDHFKAMEGSWVLTPSEDGNSTILELTSHLDLGLPIPHMWMNSITTRKLETRVGHIKKMAEAANLKVASKDHLLK